MIQLSDINQANHKPSKIIFKYLTLKFQICNCNIEWIAECFYSSGYFYTSISIYRENEISKFIFVIIPVVLDIVGIY